MDWNNDGKKDLLTGEYSGNVRIYLNTGTDANPVFSGYTYVKLGTANYDAGSYSVPWIVDWNSDGKKDLICGESTGRVQLLINIGTDANPFFETMEYLKDGASNLDPGSTVSPAAVDWNRDGKKDLLVGEYQGNIFYYENIGTDADPIFEGNVKLTAGGSIIDVEYYARVCVADWDGDGVMDLLSGNRNYSASPSGGVLYFHAVGPLSVSSNVIDASMGRKTDLYLDAGAANGGRNYIILGSMSGTEPGTPLPGGMATLPINWDAFTTVMLGLINTPFFSNFMGTLTNVGEATATFDPMGPIPQLAGYNMYFAYALNSPFDYASNGVAIEIVP